MAKTVTTLVEVRTKSGTSGKGPWTMSIFKAADGREYTTFKGDLASRANSLLNTVVELEYSERQNGQYTNYDLEGVHITQAEPVAETKTEVVPLSQPAKNDQFRTKEQIMRTDALNATLTLFASIGLDPLSGVDEFEGWFWSLLQLIEDGTFQPPRVSVEA